MRAMDAVREILGDAFYARVREELAGIEEMIAADAMAEETYFLELAGGENEAYAWWLWQVQQALADGFGPIDPPQVGDLLERGLDLWSFWREGCSPMDTVFTLLGEIEEMT